MIGFLKSHPKFPILMADIRDLPAHLVTGPARRIAATGVSITPQIARQFRRQFWLALSDWPSSRYMNTIASQFNGRVSLARTVGRAATWYVPAAIGLYNLANAAPELRMRTFFEEGFGVVGGALGTYAGTFAGIGIATVFCLGSLGLFGAVFVCASALGIGLGEGGNVFGGKAYDIGDSFQNQIFHSVDELIGAF